MMSEKISAENGHYPVGEHPDLPPPVSQNTALIWLRDNLFSTWYNAIFTVIGVALLGTLVPAVYQWAFADADFFVSSRDQCTSGGACWGVVTQRINLYLYGFYPPELYWRPNLFFALMFVAVIPVLYEVPYRKHWLKFTIIYPLVAFWLLYGGFLGLEQVASNKIGGVLLTITLGVMGIALSLPIGILLALGRRSDTMPVVSMICTLFIEFIRGVPMITLLFMATVVFPIFLPPGANVDQLFRVMFVVVMFASAYMAEVIRGGLQAIPKGQLEAAHSLGLSYWQMMRLIVLPQALRICIPNIVTNFIGLFKDTSLVVIVGMFDILGVGKGALTIREWIGLSVEVYTFVALVFFIFCYSMAKYSTYLEKKVSVGYNN